MEGMAGPRPEVMEQPLLPNLLVEMGGIEITVFGQTGTIDDLADMCPEDLRAPDVNQQAVNDFVVKEVNKTGVAINPKYEGIFATTLERLKIEPRYSLLSAEPKPSNDKLEPKPHDIVAERPQAKTAVAEVINVVNIPKHPERIRMERVLAEATLASSQLIAEDETKSPSKIEAKNVPTKPKSVKPAWVAKELSADVVVSIVRKVAPARPNAIAANTAANKAPQPKEPDPATKKAAVPRPTAVRSVNAAPVELSEPDRKSVV